MNSHYLRARKQVLVNRLELVNGRASSSAVQVDQARLKAAIQRIDAEICFNHPDADREDVNQLFREFGRGIGLVIGLFVGLLLMCVAMPVFFVWGAIALAFDKKIDQIK